MGQPHSKAGIFVTPTGYGYIVSHYPAFTSLVPAVGRSDVASVAIYLSILPTLLSKCLNFFIALSRPLTGTAKTRVSNRGFTAVACRDYFYWFIGGIDNTRI